MPPGDPIVAKPKLRADLELYETSERGEACTYVRDPLAHAFLRLGSTARLAAELMDGSLDTSQISAALSERCGVPIPSSKVESLCRTLASAGLLEGSATPKGRRVRGNALYLVVPLLDPNHWMDRWAPLWRAIVSVPTVALLIALIVAGGVLMVVAHQSGVSLVPRELGLFDLVAFYVATSFAIAGHELAHAATLKRFGGQVHEMGFLLLYFSPCFFCNVSDAYMIPRRQRLWVSFAGIFFELGLWGAATVAAFYLGVETPAGRLAGLLMTVVGLRCVLLNLNPLIKLDGYYLLVDLLEIPNLRQRAFAMLTERLRGLIGRPSADETRRDRRLAAILLAYAVMAVGFLVAVFFVLATKLVELWREPSLSVTSVVLALFAGFLLLRGARALIALFRPVGPSEEA